MDGDTPLHVLVRRGDRYAVGLLITHGAEVNAVGDLGETPMNTAVSAGDADIVEQLMRAAARTNIRCVFGHTAFERGSKVATLRKLLAQQCR